MAQLAAPHRHTVVELGGPAEVVEDVLARELARSQTGEEVGGAAFIRLPAQQHVVGGAHELVVGQVPHGAAEGPFQAIPQGCDQSVGTHT